MTKILFMELKSLSVHYLYMGGDIDEMMEQIKSVLKKEGKTEYRKLRKKFPEYNEIEFFQGIVKLKREGTVERVTNGKDVMYGLIDDI